MITPRITNKPPNERELEKWHEKWQESTGHLEDVWLARSPYLAGDHLTVADLLGEYSLVRNNRKYSLDTSGICEMMQPIAGGFDLDTKKYPRVHNWIERVKKETQPHFDESHAIVLRVREQILKSDKSKL